MEKNDDGPRHGFEYWSNVLSSRAKTCSPKQIE